MLQYIMPLVRHICGPNDAPPTHVVDSLWIKLALAEGREANAAGGGSFNVASGYQSNASWRQRQ